MDSNPTASSSNECSNLHSSPRQIGNENEEGICSALNSIRSSLDFLFYRVDVLACRLGALQLKISLSRKPNSKREIIAARKTIIEDSHDEYSINYVDVPRRKWIEVKLASVESTRDFYVQVDENGVQEFQTLLNDFHKKNPPQLATRFFSDKLCCVFIENEYFRARLIQDDGSNFLVCLVDLGIFREVEIDQVYDLHERFNERSSPVFALSCFLPCEFQSIGKTMTNDLFQFLAHWSLDFVKLDAYFKAKNRLFKVFVKLYDPFYKKFPAKIMIDDLTKSFVLSNYKVIIDIDLSPFNAQIFSFEGCSLILFTILLSFHLFTEFFGQNGSVMEYSDASLERKSKFLFQ